MIGFFLKFKILGGLYLGWGIGANDSANIFGTAVATNSIRFRTAVILIAIFVIVGSLVEGPKLFDYMKFSEEANSNMALAATLAAALTITVITYLSIPTSTSQAAVGAFMGIAVSTAGFAAVEWGKFLKMLVCWILNPIVSLLLCILLIKVLGSLMTRFVRSGLVRDRLIKAGLIVFGSYGAYALGANNVVVTTAPYYHAGIFGVVGSKTAAFWAAAVGGVSIALGALTYSRRVMVTIGRKITALDPFTALVVVLTHSLALHLFTQFNVPVSSSQAVVGAVIGVGIFHGAETVNQKTLIKIFIGWLATPLISAVLACAISLLIVKVL